MLYIIISVMAILLVIGLVILPFILLPWLAEGNILFTAVREGTAKAIMRGKTFERFIMSYKGHHFDDKWNIVEHDESDNDIYDDRNTILKHFGLYWIGWPWSNSVYVYSFQWNETMTDEKGREKVFRRAEATDFIYVVDFVYAIVTSEAETKEMLPTDELTLVTVYIVNPYKALFKGEDWMQRITAAINRHVRTFVGNKSYEDLISTTTNGVDDSTEFSAPVLILNDALPDDPPANKLGLIGHYGVAIRTADLQSIELSGTGKTTNAEASTKRFVAERDAEATLIAGKANADVTRMQGDAEAEALEKRLKVIEEHPSGITLAGYDALRDAAKNGGTNTIWANDPLGAIAGILKDGGKKKGDE